MDYAQLMADLEATLAAHAAGGMVGAFVLAVELYDETGEPQLHTMRTAEHTNWTHLGMIEALHMDTAEPLRRIYAGDTEDEGD